MAIKLNELEPTGKRWNAPSKKYPQGSFINGTGLGKRDGSFAKAEWANDIFGFLGAILSHAKITPNGQVETADQSQIFDGLKTIVKSDIDTFGGDPTANASGTVNEITATFSKSVTLEGGKRVQVRALGANTSETVTFAPNGLTAKPVVKGDGSALSVGDIASAGFWMTLIYDATLQKWILQNPATGVKTVLPDASESTQGIIQIANQAEVSNGTNTTKAVTPKTLKDTYLPLAGGELKQALLFDPFGTVSTVTDTRYRGLDITALKRTDVGYESTSVLSLRNLDATDEAGMFSLRTGNLGAGVKVLQGFPNGKLFWDGKEIERVNSMGDNWIRFESGLQICFGYSEIPAGWTNLMVNLPVPCKNGGHLPTCSYTDVYRNNGLSISTNTENSPTSFKIQGTNSQGVGNFQKSVYWLDIGFWK